MKVPDVHHESAQANVASRHNVNDSMQGIGQRSFMSQALSGAPLNLENKLRKDVSIHQTDKESSFDYENASIVKSKMNQSLATNSQHHKSQFNHLSN